MGADALPDEAEALLQLAEECSLSLTQARERIRRIEMAHVDWKTTARKNSIREQEITMMAESLDARLAAVSEIRGRSVAQVGQGVDEVSAAWGETSAVQRPIGCSEPADCWTVRSFAPACGYWTVRLEALCAARSSGTRDSRDVDWCPGHTDAVDIIVRPATVFDDVAAVVGPKKPTSNVCFCLSYRIGSKENNTLRGLDRAARVRELCAQEPPPGVIAYLDDEPVGWAAVHPRADTSFARNRRIPHLDDLDVWSLWCFRVRPGHRKQGVTHALIDGAVEHARASDAPAIEGYPVDNAGERVDLTMAYVGTRKLFEDHGFVRACDTTSVLDGFPRMIMRRSFT